MNYFSFQEQLQRTHVQNQGGGEVEVREGGGFGWCVVGEWWGENADNCN